MKTITTVYLDVNKTRDLRQYDVRQGDKDSREFHIILTENGQPITLTSGMSATADAVVRNVIVAQGEALTVDTANQYIVMTLTEEMLTLAGNMKIDVKVSESGAVLTAATLVLYVGAAVINENTHIEPGGTTIGAQIIALNTRVDAAEAEIADAAADVSALQDALLHSYYEIALATEWEQGGISTNGVEDDTLTGKKRSGFIDATQFDSISKVNATGINVVYYNADTTFGRFTWIASGTSALVDHTYPYIRFSVASSVNAGDIHLYKNIPLKTDVDALKSARHFDFVTLLPGMSGFLDYNTVEGTLTIPKDTLLIGYNADGVKTYKAINPSAAIVLTGVNFTSLHSSSVKLLLNTDSYTFLVKTYTQAQAANEYLVATIRLKYSTYQPSIFSPLSWTIDGVPFGIQPNHLPFAAFKKSKAVRGINHRGWHEAPENTLTAFRLSRRKGFDYVETDVQFTSDGVPVLLHDDTINRTARTSNGGTIAESIDIGSITYAAASAYDYGIWKGAGFAGEPLPTFEEFIVLCRNLGLTPYVEIKKALTASQAATLLNIVRQNGMKGHVVWISFTKANLELFKSNDPVAVMGLLCTTVTQEIITDALNLKTDTNEVFVNANITNITDERIALCVNAGLPLSVWTVDQESAIISANPYITGITSNKFDAGLVLYNAGISAE